MRRLAQAHLARAASLPRLRQFVYAKPQPQTCRYPHQRTLQRARCTCETRRADQRKNAARYSSAQTTCRQRRGGAHGNYPSNGFSTGTPVLSKCLMLRVTTVNVLISAVADISFAKFANNISINQELVVHLLHVHPAPEQSQSQYRRQEYPLRRR